MTFDEMNDPTPPDPMQLQSGQDVPAGPGLPPPNVAAAVPSQPPQGGGVKSMLKGMLSNFLQGPPQMQAQRAQARHLDAQTGLVNKQASMMDQMVQTPMGLMPFPLAQKVMGPAIAAGARVESAQIGANSRQSIADGKKSALEQLSKGYVTALQAGDQEQASATLEHIRALSGATKPTTQGQTTKVDPIIYSYLGAPPDPKTDPSGAKNWAAEAEKIKTRMAVAPRVAGYNALNMGRKVDAYDPETDTYKFSTVGGAMHDGLLPAAIAYKNMPKVAQFGEMQTAAQNLRGAVKNLDSDFTPSQRAKLQMAMASPSESILSNEIAAMLGSEQLSPSQQDYVIWLKQMNERLLSLRNVAGMGQGAEDMRKAIQATLPNVRSANKAYAMKQMDAVDQQISTLFQGIGGKKQVPGVIRDKKLQSDTGVQIIRDSNGRITGIK